MDTELGIGAVAAAAATKCFAKSNNRICGKKRKAVRLFMKLFLCMVASSFLLNFLPVETVLSSSKSKRFDDDDNDCDDGGRGDDEAIKNFLLMRSQSIPKNIASRFE